jgi:hypothetical protein
VEIDLVRNAFSVLTKSTKVSTDTNKQPTFSMETRDYISGRADKNEGKSVPCGGGIEYLHRDPASRRRRRKGKSQM